MSEAVNRRQIRDYLSFGFVPDAGLASQYLHQLFDERGTHDGDPAKLLIEIVADLTSGANEVAIPLSGGRDSRALLGAALEIFSRQDVHCLTFGSDGSPDVERARAVCLRTGVEHRILDPDGLDWDLDALTSRMRQRWREQGGTPPIDGLLVFGKLAELIPADVPVLSGFLGIVAIGKHMGDAVSDGASPAVARFMAQNHGVIDERPDRMFREFLPSHEALRSKWPGLTKFDLLDFGFRQRLRIRPSVTGAFHNVVRVYEDRRWLRHWLGKPLSARLEYDKYDEILARTFAPIFGRQPLLSRIRRWRALRGGPVKGVYRGDVRRNPSMAAALEQACRSFDARGIDTGQSAVAAFERLMREGSLAAFRNVRWFSSAEIFARAQEQDAAEVQA